MMKIPFGRPMIGEEEKRAVADVMNGPVLVHGPRSVQFEEKFAAFTGADCAVAVSSCTAALHLAYFDLGIGPGDDVIIPAQTHNATAHAVEYTGARPVFVDAEMETGNIDIEQIESSITERTKAISIVHYLGMPVAMDRICAIAKQHGLFLVEDCALAIGTYYKGIHAGLWGDAGCFSFYPVKHMTTAEGGMFITRNTELADRLSRKRAFGVDRVHSDRKVPGLYDVDRLGYNYRMSEIHAAIGVVQLEKVKAFLERRRRNYEILYSGMQELDEVHLFRSTEGDFQSSYYCMSAVLEKSLANRRYDIVKHLNTRGVGTSIYYPKPVPHFSYYADKYGYGADSYPVAASISNRSIAFPVGPHLNDDEMTFIINAFKDAIAMVR